MGDSFLYFMTVLFWGTSWFAITFQLGVVPPEASIAYRFGLAAILMFAICAATRRPMRFSLRDHLFMALQGLCLFSVNYFFIYLATRYLTSGQVAVVFAAIVVLNLIGSAVFFRTPVQLRVAVGALLGIVGLIIVFWPDIRAFDLSRSGSLGLLLAFGGTLSASLGNMVSFRNQRHGLPVIQTNAYGMTYGAGLLLLFCLANGTRFTFDWSMPYVASLLFLSFCATVLAFWFYLTLLGRVGTARAGYVTVLFPLVALTVSTLFEGFAWTPLALSGVVLVLLGNVLVLKRKPTAETAGTAARFR